MLFVYDMRGKVLDIDKDNYHIQREHIVAKSAVIG